MGIPSRGNTSGQNSHKKGDSAFFQESTLFSAGTGEKKRTAPYATGVPDIARNPRCSAGRSSRIRTNGPLLPKQVRYQTAPCSAEPLQATACTGMPYLTKFCKSPAWDEGVQFPEKSPLFPGRRVGTLRCRRFYRVARQDGEGRNYREKERLFLLQKNSDAFELSPASASSSVTSFPRLQKDFSDAARFIRASVEAQKHTPLKKRKAVFPQGKTAFPEDSG